MSLRLGIPIWSNLKTSRRAVPLLLDNLAATYGAWSVARQIRTAYNGPLIRVRESGSNSEADINAVNGVLDEASLASHCGANSGYITKIYNQDANGSTLDLAQATTTVQPIIVESGTIVKDGGKPAAKFVAADSRRLSIAASTSLFVFLHNGTPSTIASVQKPNNTAGAKALLTTHQSLSGVGFSIRFASDERLALSVTVGGGLYAVSVTKGSTALTSHAILSVVTDAGNASPSLRETAWHSGSVLSGENASNATPATGSSGAIFGIGTRGPTTSEGFDGTIQELIIWPTDETASRTTWESDMADFYGVTLT